MKVIQLQNSSAQKITAHIFAPETDLQKLVVINSATGVKQQLYFNTAKYLAANGFTVITYDYTGIGLSKPLHLKTCSSSMRTWGTEDFKAVTDYVQTYYKHYRKFLLGHSVGALILGMNPDAALFERFVFMSTQKAHAAHLKFKIKMLAYGGFGIIQPVCTQLFGYFPAHRFNLGESLPAGVARDWRTLILNRKSTNALLEEEHLKNAENLTQPVHVIYADDDAWLTEKGVKSLMKETYPHLKPAYTLLKSKLAPKNKIGHVHFFRSYNSLFWEIILKEFQK